MKQIKENENSAPGRRRRSVLKTQKRAIAILLVCVILLGVGIGVAKYYIDQIIYTDFDGLKSVSYTHLTLPTTSRV